MINTDLPLNLSVKDVHDFAIEIAMDFEKLSEFCEMGDITHLINKIINVLELLEANVMKIENTEREIADLKMISNNVNKEKLASEESKWKLQQEFEEMEKTWEVETAQLKSTIIFLKEKNEHLINIMDNKTLCQSDTCDDKALIEDQENIIYKLSASLKSFEKKLQKSFADIEILNLKIEQLQSTNQSLQIQYKKAKKKFEDMNFEHGRKICNQDQSPISKSSFARDCKHIFSDEFNESEQFDMEYELKDDNLSSTNIIAKLQQEKYDLQDQVQKLEQELSTVKMQAKYFKEKFEHSSENLNQKNFQSSSGIRQLFQLFLGMVVF